ncbi:MAG: NADH:ubiquinone reductase (Na(+)-transporting) subunit C [Candidatus Marinimicrobia bacterium]|nr:NADH:ubiquinone reductase (Na(+)-transporting) subunit C [Candidatus Neomarinimicrobiota bacterium]|tara:strand:- start:7696 stop:8400 length:705 start_codon:yes stop_codon:yes gene_type:complete
MKNKYIFILSITIVCGMLLALFSEGLKSKTIFNQELDKKKNILETIGVNVKIMENDEIMNYFNDNIKEIVLDANGVEFSNIKHNELEIVEDNITGELTYSYNGVDYLPAYISEKKNALIIPVSGKGLWSSLYGYFALDITNYSTVKGITFYRHGETPGLGAEITKSWFKTSFIDKEIYLDNQLQSIIVTKAGQADKSSLYEVDGISGATITSRGVEVLLKRDLLRYEKYFRINK